ncbi:MAG TPA: hypothetical protein VE035_06335 [Puia sp.]|nr:hypothetical protein [Puia sp.]
MFTPYKIVLLLSIATLVAGIAFGQNASNWNMNSSLTVSNTSSNVSASSVTLGNPATTGAFNGGSEYYGEGGWPAGALDPNAYFQFNVKANSGYYLVTNSVTMLMRRSNTGTPAGSGPTKWSLRSSLDNYSSDISTGSMTDAYATYTISLPAAFQSIPSVVTFRLYGYNTTISSGGTSRLVFDNISVQGHAASGVLAERSIGLEAGVSESNSIALQWDPAGFAAGTIYEVQRSVNGYDFDNIYQVQAVTANARTYHYEDLSPFSSGIFYRISASIPGGPAYLSPIVSVKIAAPSTMQIAGVVPQGAGASLKAFLLLPSAGEYRVLISSSDGKALAATTLNAQTGSLAADISFGAYPHGVYILTLAGAGRRISRQFIN